MVSSGWADTKSPIDIYIEIYISLKLLHLLVRNSLTHRNPVEDASFGLNCSSSCAQYPWVVSLTLLIYYGVMVIKMTVAVTTLTGWGNDTVSRKGAVCEPSIPWIITSFLFFACRGKHFPRGQKFQDYTNIFYLENCDWFCFKGLIACHLQFRCADSSSCAASFQS